MRVVFMGTPDIAATCLKQIIADGFEVVGVYTQPDRPKGRGMKMTFSPVKGPEGNIEFLAHLTAADVPGITPDTEALVTQAHNTLNGGAV